MRNFVPLKLTLYWEPLPAGDVVPKCQAHLSAFSWPRWSNHAFKSGSVTLSDSSCAMRLAMESPARSPFGVVVCSAQAEGHRAGFPMKPYLMSVPLSVPWVCQAQYCVQKPEVSVTSCEVSTK